MAIMAMRVVTDVENESLRSAYIVVAGVSFLWLLNQILCDLPTNKLNKLNSNQCQLLLLLPLNLNIFK